MICFSSWFWLWCAFYNRPLKKHIILFSKCTSRQLTKEYISNWFLVCTKTKTTQFIFQFISLKDFSVLLKMHIEGFVHLFIHKTSTSKQINTLWMYLTSNCIHIFWWSSNKPDLYTFLQLDVFSTILLSVIKATVSVFKIDLVCHVWFNF